MTFTVILWIVGATTFGMGWVLAVAMVADKYRQRAKHWERTAQELDDRWAEAEGELAEAEAELAEAEATIAQQKRDMGKVYDAGIIAGQTIQRDREDNGLL